jgi:hypothetical protein
MFVAVGEQNLDDLARTFEPHPRKFGDPDDLVVLRAARGLVDATPDKLHPGLSLYDLAEAIPGQPLAGVIRYFNATAHQRPASFASKCVAPPHALGNRNQRGWEGGPTIDPVCDLSS